MAFVEVNEGIKYRNVSKGDFAEGEVFIGHLVEVKEKEFEKKGKKETGWTFIFLDENDEKVGIAGGGPLAFRMGYKPNKKGEYAKRKILEGELCRLEYQGKVKMGDDMGHSWSVQVDDSGGGGAEESSVPETKTPNTKKGAKAAAEVFGGTEEIPF